MQEEEERLDFDFWCVCVCVCGNSVSEGGAQMRQKGRDALFDFLLVI